MSFFAAPFLRHQHSMRFLFCKNLHRREYYGNCEPGLNSLLDATLMRSITVALGIYIFAIGLLASVRLSDVKLLYSFQYVVRLSALVFLFYVYEDSNFLFNSDT